MSDTLVPTTPLLPTTPLASIGLSCSGGGYRAATFHLGAMSYLNHLQYNGKPLLENVKMLSTVSGGTITGIIYALRKQRGESFKDIYEFILAKLKVVDLVKDGITKLSPAGEWDNELKRKNFINAFAELYDKEFTEGKCIGEFDEMKSHLAAVCFNSTEFDNGINFRFRDTKSGRFGNDRWRVPDAAAKEVKLSDAMASSSGFTGGFEPMVWPDDFTHADSKNIEALKTSGNKVGLMDGGIYDNQGVQSLLLYENKTGVQPFDLIIISDVTSPYMNGYEPEKGVEGKPWAKSTVSGILNKAKKINKIVNWAFIGLIILFGLLPLALFNGYKNNIWTGIFLALSTVLLVLFFVKMKALGWLRQSISTLQGHAEKIVGPYFFPRFKLLRIDQLPFGTIYPLLLDRVNSLYTLFMDVFLKVVRRLNYDSLYDDEKHEYRRMTNVMRELTEQDYLKKGKDNAKELTLADGTIIQSAVRGPYETTVGDPIKVCAELACSFGTTLWFTETELVDGMLDKLVACGQFTMCYNMIDYLESVIYGKENGYAALEPAVRENLEKIFRACIEDWQKFKEEPDWLLREMQVVSR